MSHLGVLRGFVRTSMLIGCVAVALPSPASASDPKVNASANGSIVADQAELEVQLSDGVSMRLEPGTRYKRLPGTALMLSSSAATTPTHVVLLEQGRVEIEIPAMTGRRQPAHAVMIRSSNNELAVIKGGRAIVQMRGGSLVVANQHGETLVGTAQSVHPLAVGTIRNGNATVAMLGAPALQLGPRVGLWIGDRVVPIVLQWDPVQGARAWRVELRDPISSRVVRRIRLEERALSIGDESLPVGSYDVSIRALDEYDIEGAASPPERVTVTSALFPEGAFVDDRGRIRISAGQTVGFTHAEQLEVARAEVFQWSKGSAPVGLGAGASTKLFLRQAGSHIGIPVVLAPRDIRAEVRMGPGTAVWPTDPVIITVRLRDESGQSPSWLQAFPRVTVGLKPVAVSWERVGDGLRAIVAPQGGPGPWVVRVDVRDQFGIPLGSDFLEVVRHR